MEVLQHPPYSPDIAPSDYHLFKSMEHSLRDKKFSNVEEVKNHLDFYFNNKPPEFYDRGIKKLPILWRKIIDNDGKYLIE